MIIGFTGRKQSGKNTSASILKNKYGGTCFNFAEPLKQIVSVLTGVHPSLFEFEQQKNKEVPDYLKTDKIHTYRELLQYIGTDVLRNTFGSNIFVNLMDKHLKESKNYLLSESAQYSHIYFTDVRFNSEAEYIKNMGGIIIKLTRFNDKPIEHESENIDLVKEDILIDNSDGDLIKLETNLIETFDELNSIIS